MVRWFTFASSVAGLVLTDTVFAFALVTWVSGIATSTDRKQIANYEGTLSYSKHALGPLGDSLDDFK